MPRIEKETITTRRVVVWLDRGEVQEAIKKYALASVPKEDFYDNIQCDIRIYWNSIENSGAEIIFRKETRDEE